MTRWDSKSKDATQLEGMFRKGMIAHDAKAGTIRDGNPNWKKNYTSGQFRNAFNRLKKIYSTACLKEPPAAKGNFAG
jgi:hypothetical protein